MSRNGHGLMQFMVLILLIFNLLFFWHIWSKPFKISRSELLSTFFPSWLYIGRQIRNRQSWKTEPCYWLNFHAHPVLSSYYPPHVLTAWIGAYLSLDSAFVLLTRTLLLHFVWMSLGWYWLFSLSYTPLIALFGAITLTYAGYNIKQQPCIVYTIAWLPYMLLGIAQNNMLLAGLACGLTLLAGYYPIGIQTIPIAIGAALVWGAHPWFIPIGVLIGLPQLIPFLKYLPKTIRKASSRKIEVGPWEKKWYVGVLPWFLAFFSTSRVWPLLIVSSLLTLGLLSKYLPRISYRWLFTVQFCLGWMALSGLSNLHLSATTLYGVLFIQGFDLYLHNSRLIPTLPLAELYKRPSTAFKTQITAFLEANLKPDERVSGLPYPLFTGIINNIKTLGYCGGMQLRLMAKFRGDTNPNGSGAHDWFKLKEDSSALARHRVRFAYSRKAIDKWLPTQIKGLWSNPNYCSN